MKKKNSPFNLVVSLAVAVAAVIYFSLRTENTAPVQGTGNSAQQHSHSNEKPSAKVAVDGTQSPETTTAKSNAAPAPTSEVLPAGFPRDRVKVTQGAGPTELPADLQAQLNAVPPELPDDLKRQLASPPPELPADLKAQLNAPPPELPDDIKRAMQIAPRTVTIDEVNHPEKYQGGAEQPAPN